MELQELLKQLAKARKAQDEATAKMRQIIEETECSQAYMYAKALKEQSDSIANETRAEIEKLGLAEFEVHPDNKTINEAVKIRVNTRFEYDQATAFNWALDHKMALTLDKKAFDGIAKADSTRPDFVTVKEEPSVTIAQDLSAYLE